VAVEGIAVGQLAGSRQPTCVPSGAHGAFPWLGQLSDRERPLTDTRSLLVRDREAIDQAWARLDGRIAGTLVPAPAPEPGNRSRRARSGR
jgi:hypothetical protein